MGHRAQNLVALCCLLLQTLHCDWLNAPVTRSERDRADLRVFCDTGV